jgi:uncharacterized membrane protein
MAYNVWMKIWPAQQKIIRALKEGQAPDPALVKLAGMRSRQNTYLSVPLLFFMLSVHQPTTFGTGSYWLAVLVIAGGFGLVYLLYKKAPQVQGF